MPFFLFPDRESMACLECTEQQEFEVSEEPDTAGLSMEWDVPGPSMFWHDARENNDPDTAGSYTEWHKAKVSEEPDTEGGEGKEGAT